MIVLATPSGSLTKRSLIFHAIPPQFHRQGGYRVTPGQVERLRIHPHFGDELMRCLYAKFNTVMAYLSASG